MIVSSPSDSPARPVSDQDAAARTAEIDASCRVPVLVLFLAAAVWLTFGSLLGVMTAIKAHAPGFLADSAWLTYGRLRPAATNALLYGFALPAGLGLALWMFCRLGRTRLRGAAMITGAAGFWNLGLILGTAGILAGGSTGYEWLELPGMASPILFSGYVLAAAWAVVTLHLRQERDLFVSQWLALAALLWFPWVYSTAQLLLIFFPVRGVMQVVVNGWFAHNFYELCLAPLGLAAIFYFVPKLLLRPLHSHGLALFGFWMLVLFGGWGGLRPGLPVPNWLGSVSFVARVFVLVALIAFALSWFRTWAGARAGRTSPDILRFFVVGAGSYLVAAVLETIATHPLVSQVTLFTLFEHAIGQLKIHGFLAMVLAGAIYYIAPRLVGVDWPGQGLIRWHFICGAGGTGLIVLASLIGGLLQGARINQPEIEFIRVARGTVPFLGMSTLGATLQAAGYVALLINFSRLLIACCPCAALAQRFRAMRLPIQERSHA